MHSLYYIHPLRNCPLSFIIFLPQLRTPFLFTLGLVVLTFTSYPRHIDTRLLLILRCHSTCTLSLSPTLLRLLITSPFTLYSAIPFITLLWSTAFSFTPPNPSAQVPKVGYTLAFTPFPFPFLVPFPSSKAKVVVMACSERGKARRADTSLRGAKSWQRHQR